MSKLLTIGIDEIQTQDLHLRSKSRPITTIDENIHILAGALIEVLANTPHGTGLSAIQIGVPLRIFIINMSRTPGKETIMVNPIVEKISGRWETRQEGCLSLPNYKGPVSRKSRILVRAGDLHGAEFHYFAKGYEAAVIQHEVDHLDGIFYWDRMPIGAKPLPLPLKD